MTDALTALESGADRPLLRNHWPVKLPTTILTWAALFSPLSWAGCGDAAQPQISPEQAAAYAIELYDANHDGAVDGAEAASCPPLASAFATYDGNGDNRLTADEVASRLSRLYSAPNALAEMSCLVLVDGRPLPGAVVRLRPAEMLGASVLPAEGIADDQGVARPTIGDDKLPSEYRGAPLVQLGLYHVEITHPQRQLPARFNTKSELGLEVDPAHRSGTFARFDLTSK
jgi:hypothetical protein